MNQIYNKNIVPYKIPEKALSTDECDNAFYEE